MLETFHIVAKGKIYECRIKRVKNIDVLSKERILSMSNQKSEIHQCPIKRVEYINVQSKEGTNQCPM